MSILKLKDVLIIDRNYDPRKHIEPQHFSSHDPSVKEFTFTCNEFRKWWAMERLTGLWVHRPNQYSTFYRQSNDPETPLPFKTLQQVSGRRTLYSWRLTFACRRYRKKKVVFLPRESIGQCCKAQIFIAQPVGEINKVLVRYAWKHNHTDSRAQLPLAPNEREWVRRMVDIGHDWRSMSTHVIPDDPTLQAMEGAGSDLATGAVSGNMFINADRVRRTVSKKRCAEYQKDKDVVKSVKLWFHENEGGGGKTLFVEDVALTGFAYGWCTRFQLKVMSKNSDCYCMDSTYNTARNVVPKASGSKVHSPVYLYTLLVKDKDVHQGIPVAYMVCKSESRYPIIRWLDWLKNECGLKTGSFVVDCAEAESYAVETVFPTARIHYCNFHVAQLWERQLNKFSNEQRKQMRPRLSEIRLARSNELQQTLWTKFKELFPFALSLISYIQKNWFDKEGRLEKWAMFHCPIGQDMTTNNWIESWHSRLKGYHLDGCRNLRIDRLIFLLQGRVDREYRFAYIKAERGFQSIPWRKSDDERKQKADSFSFDEARRKITFSNEQSRIDGRSQVFVQSFDPTTPDEHHVVLFRTDTRQLLSCSCAEFKARNPLPCKHLFLAERLIPDSWTSRFLCPSDIG